MRPGAVLAGLAGLLLLAGVLAESLLPGAIPRPTAPLAAAPGADALVVAALRAEAHGTVALAAGTTAPALRLGAAGPGRGVLQRSLKRVLRRAVNPVAAGVPDPQRLLLARALDESAPLPVRASAARTLARVGDPVVLDALSRGLDLMSPVARAALAEILAEHVPAAGR